MIEPSKFVKYLSKNKINFFTGVPDSLFKSLCIYLEKKQKKNNFVAANEGSSVGLAIGYFLAKKKITFSLSSKFWIRKYCQSISFNG